MLRKGLCPQLLQTPPRQLQNGLAFPGDGEISQVVAAGSSMESAQRVWQCWKCFSVGEKNKQLEVLNKERELSLPGSLACAGSRFWRSEWLSPEWGSCWWQGAGSLRCGRSRAEVHRARRSSSGWLREIVGNSVGLGEWQFLQQGTNQLSPVV